MLNFSEYVSLGHPDKIADYISQYLLDRYVEQDPNTRYAVEVQIKDNHVCIGGEVTSKTDFSTSQIAKFATEAVNEIGYTRKYQDKWGIYNTICGEDLLVDVFINKQSPDIAQGLNGWGDQGIFFGMYNINSDDGMPDDHSLAKSLCKDLFESGLGGLDIKTQVVMDYNFPTKVIVAIPLLPNGGVDELQIEDFVRDRIKSSQPYEVIVNGTRKYVRHSTIADCGTTGRKLAVDFYGGNCRIGGGSPWTKDGSKADLALNLFARYKAKQYALKYGVTVYSHLACCIGKSEVDYCLTTADGKIIEDGAMTLNPADIICKFRLDSPLYASMCRWGLFGAYQQDKPWEEV